MIATTAKAFAVHFDQKFVGTFDTYADAKDVLMAHSPHFEPLALVPSGADVVEVFVCRPNGIVNYAYGSITGVHDG